METKNYTDEDYKKFDIITAKLWRENGSLLCTYKSKNKCYIEVPKNEIIDVPWLLYFRVLANVNNTFPFLHAKIYLRLPHKKVKQINKKLKTKFKSYRFKKEKSFDAEPTLKKFKKEYLKELHIIAEEYYDIKEEN